MSLRILVLSLALAALRWAPLPAAATLMPLDEVRPGMTGVGETVFQGTELEKFQVHIIGVLRNVQGPRRNLILAKLEGGPLAQTGVIAGMSGSPVYVDGRLIGAVSYSIGAFSKEPIAGITPIAEMIDATSMPPRRTISAQARVELPVTREGFAAAIRSTYAQLAPFAERPADVQAIGLPSSTAVSLSQLGVMLRPISTPLVMSGFDAPTATWMASTFRDAGFSPALGGGAGGDAPKSTEPLRPGDAVGVSLIGGDAQMGATGTVTHVDGDRLYAFGHPFFNLGPTTYPMTRAYVYTSLPSLMESFKIATLGDVIGTIQQDRATAIAGSLGKGPDIVPMSITLTSDRGGTRTFTYSLVNDQLFTPLLAYVALFNTLGSYERQFGAATFKVKGHVAVDKHADLAFEDVFTENPAAGASAYVAGPLAMLLSNDIEPITVKDVELTIASAEEPLSARIERVWLDDIKPRAGHTVSLKVLTRTYRGAEKISTIPIELPANASGQLSILVSDGRQLNQIEQREMRRSLQPQSVTQMIRLLNDTHRNNRIYVRLLSGTPGAVVNGEALTSLPPSVLGVLEGDRNGGDFTPIRSAPLGQWELPMDTAVVGSRVLTIDVENRPF